jgi:hypothetical protein
VQLYRISGARISPTRDSQYGGATCAYDMIVTNETQFQELQDDSSFPYHSLRPQPLKELQAILMKQQAEQGGPMQQMGGSTNLSYLVDVMGIVVEYAPMQCACTYQGPRFIQRSRIHRALTDLSLCAWCLQRSRRRSSSSW